MKVGYVRISTREQNTARQDVLMEKLGVEKVYTDKLSGKNTERPELQKMMDFVREGDMVVVESFSRFARNLRDLLDLTETLEKKGVQFISQKERIDTSGPAGRLMLQIFGALAEFERETILFLKLNSYFGSSNICAAFNPSIYFCGSTIDIKRTLP